MNIQEKITRLLHAVIKPAKPDMSTYESRQAFYKASIPQLAFFSLLFTTLIAAIITIDDQIHISIRQATAFIMSMVAYFYAFSSLIDAYASIDSEHFLDKVPPLKALKRIKRNRPINIGSKFNIIIISSACLYIIVKTLHPIFTTYPLMEPSSIFLTIEKVASIYEVVLVISMIIILFRKTAEAQHIASLDKKNTNIKYVVFFLALHVLTFVLYKNAPYPSIQLPVKYVSNSVHKTINYSSLHISEPLQNFHTEIYNAAFMGDAASQMLLVNSFTEIEFKTAPKLSNAIAFPLLNGLVNYKQNQDRVSAMIDNYPILSIQKNHENLFPNQDIDLEIRLLEMIYHGQLMQLQSELSKYDSEVFVSPLQAAKSGKESIAPLSYEILSRMIRSGILDYKVQYFANKQNHNYNPKHESAKEIIQLMTFFENAKRVN